MRTQLIVILFAILSIVFVVGCSKDEPEINPNAVRTLKGNLTYGLDVQFGLQDVFPEFNTSKNCVQFIEYLLNGTVHAQRLEIFNRSCPANPVPGSEKDRVVSLKIKKEQDTYYLYRDNESVLFGKFSMNRTTSKFVLDALCDFASDPKAVEQFNHCDISVQGEYIVNFK